MWVIPQKFTTVTSISAVDTTILTGRIRCMRRCMATARLATGVLQTALQMLALTTRQLSITDTYTLQAGLTAALLLTSSTPRLIRPVLRQASQRPPPLPQVVVGMAPQFITVIYICPEVPTVHCNPMSSMPQSGLTVPSAVGARQPLCQIPEKPMVWLHTTAICMC